MELFIVLLVLLVVALVVGFVAQFASIARNRSEIEVLKVQRRRIGEVWDWVENLSRRLQRLEEMGGVSDMDARRSTTEDIDKAKAASGQGAGSPPQARDALAVEGTQGLEDLPPAELDVKPEVEEPIPAPQEPSAPLGSTLAAWKKARQEREAQHAFVDAVSAPEASPPEAEPSPKAVGEQEEDFNIAAVEAEGCGAELTGSARLGGSLALPAGSPDDRPAETVDAAPPRRRIGFEELLGGKVFVWIGAVALVLTGAFLLKYGIQAEIITVNVRLISAAVFGFALIGVGEWMRRRSNGIAQALCGAGVATLFGVILASSQVYDRIDPPLAFGLMAFVTAGAVFLSLRHGQLVALLGMVGGFVMPVMLGDPMTGQPTMVIYLIALEIGVLAVTRKRGWVGISGLTLLASVAWSLGLTVIGSGTFAHGWTGTLVMATAVIFVLNTAWTHGQPDGDASIVRRAFWMSVSAVSAAAGMLAVLVVNSSFAVFDFVMLGLLTMGVLILARLDKRYAPLVWVASGISTLMLLAWGFQLNVLRVNAPGEVLGTIAAFGFLMVVVAYALSFGGSSRRVFGLLSAAAGPVLFAIAVFAVHQGFGWRSGAWSLWASALAVVYMLGCYGLIRLRTARSDSARLVDDWIVNALSLSAVLMLAIAIGQGLNHPWVVVGWSVLAAVIAVVGVRLKITALLPSAVGLCGVSAFGLVVPGPFEMAIHGPAVLNVLLAMYLIPTACFGVVAWAAHRAEQFDLSQGLQMLATAALGVMSLALVRDGFHVADFLDPAVAFYEWPTYAVVLLALGLLIAWASDVLRLRAVSDAAAGMGLIGMLLCVTGPVLAGNPLFHAGAVGGKALALGMFYSYLIPGALLWVWARRIDRAEATKGGPADLLRGVTVLLGFVFVGLQVRNYFHADDLSVMHMGLYERATYPVGWLAFGLAMLMWARRSGSRLAGQAGVLVATVGLAWSALAVVWIGNPLVDSAVVGGRSLMFGMGYLYLLPAGMLWVVSVFADKHAGKGVATFFRISALGLVAVFTAMQVRNGFNWTDLHRVDVGVYEWATYALVWMVMGGAVFVIGKRYAGQGHLSAPAGAVIAFLGMGVGLIGNVLIANPLWTNQSVGTTAVFNGLWYLYLPTALGLTIAGFMLHKRQKTAPARALGMGAVSLAFLLISLLVRQGFQDDGVLVLEQRPEHAEFYAYSLAWVVYGVALLIGGVFTRLGALRYGSIAVMLIAIAKVFALDTAQLEDLYRVFSFLGLGVTLIVLGYIYQRFVFRRVDDSAVDGVVG